MFIGRNAELQFLEKKYSQPGGQLIVLYGRRRIGKTETLKEFCKNKQHVFFSSRECSDTQQLEAFSEHVLRQDMPMSKYIKKFTDWETALSSITEFPYTQKKLLIIDEFPYMCKSNSSIPSILQNLWDTKLKDENIMIILCGSAMSFMEKELLAEKNPLYGRATGIYKMTEMPFSDVKQFFPNYSPLEQITVYSALGGIPHYLKQFDPTLSIDENICQNILSKGSILYSEVEFLLRQELRETALYNTIIEAIALGNTKLNDIYMKTQIERTKLSVYLKNLIDLGIVEREFSITDGIKEQANSNRGIYRLTDNFFRFWYRFVFTTLSDLEAGDVMGVYQYYVKPNLHEFCAYTFEELCREYIRMKNRKLEFSCRFTSVGRWWGKVMKTEKNSAGEMQKISVETEIDVMAKDITDNNYLYGECKYKTGAFELGDYHNLIAKIPKRDDICYTYYLFSQSGFTDAVRELEKTENVICVDLDTLVEGLD